MKEGLIILPLTSLVVGYIVVKVLPYFLAYWLIVMYH
jgi:hypothetical protein